MQKRIEALNIVQIVSNIGLVISFLFYLFTRHALSVSFYWLFIYSALLGNVWFLRKWLKGGLNIDKRKSKTIYSELDNYSMAFVVVYALVFLAIVFLQSLGVLAQDNFYVIILLFLFTIFFEVCLYISEEKVYKETKKLANQTMKKMTDDSKK